MIVEDINKRIEKGKMGDDNMGERTGGVSGTNRLANVGDVVQ